MSARDRLREYFEAHAGEVVSTKTLREVGGISEYARRIRELRDIEGMDILTHKDRAGLKPGEYLLASLKRKPAFSSAVNPQLRMQVLERNGFTCQLCGHGAGDPDPYNPSRKVRLHIDHIVPQQQGGGSTLDNLRVVCSVCNQARGNIQTPSESARNLIARIRRAPRAVQREVFLLLKKTFTE